MAAQFQTRFKRLVRAPASARARLAGELVAADVPWEQWLEQLNALHVRAPEEEVRLARLLAAEADTLGERLAAARFGLIEARALHRVGSPSEAADAFAAADRGLSAAGEHAQAVKARVLRVDALAHAGRVQEALRDAARCARSLRGRNDAVWRAVLRINRANALRLAGNLDEAIAEYEAAARAFQRRGDVHTAAIARTNAGVALMDAGRPAMAHRRFERAARTFEDLEQADMALDARHNAAWALVRRGRLGEAIAGLGSVAETHARRGLGRRAAVCRMDLAEALLRAGDDVEAERHALAAARGFADAKAPAERVEALLLAAAAARSDARRAARHVSAAKRGANAAGRPALLIRCTLLEQDARLRAGRRADARALAGATRRAARLGQTGLVADSLLLRGHVALLAGDPRRAARLFADPRLAQPGRPWARAAAETGLATCEARRGEIGRAIVRLRRVAGFLDAVRAGLPGAWLRVTFALSRLDPYVLRVDLLLQRARPQDLAEAEALLDALATRRFRERVRPEVRGRLARLRRRLEVIYDQLARGDGSTRGVAVEQMVRLQKQARTLERQVARAWRSEERAGRAGRSVETARPQPARLRRDTAAIHVWAHEDRLRALVRKGASVHAAYDLGSIVTLDRDLDRLRFHDERLRLFPGRVDPTPFLEGLAALSQRVLAPLEPHALPEVVRFVIDPAVPDVPWEVLPVSGRPFSALRRVCRLPSLRVRGPSAVPGSREAILALGEADLPGIRREFSAFDAASLRIAGADATRAALTEALTTHRVVHIAGHGYDAPDAPALAGVRMSDGWFSSVDVPKRIAAELVVLAACRTGSRFGPASLAWGGLATSLLAAGARWVLWTVEEVDDLTTAALMTRFHAGRRHGPPDAALGEAFAQLWADHGHPAGLLNFRLSGVGT